MLMAMLLLSRNLASVPGFSVHSFVDPVLSKGHQSWKTIDQIPGVHSANIVIFVDLMFAPKSFAEEAASLLRLAKKFKDKLFVVIDHHPMPTSRLAEAPNVRSIYRPNVSECTIGPRSDLMVLAALDENQRSLVEDRVRDYFPQIVFGLRRAAANGGELQGKLLTTLIRNECWRELYELGVEDRQFHRLVRGNRPKNDPRSELFLSLVSLAERLANSDVTEHNNASGTSGKEDESMAFDMQQERFVVDTSSSVFGQNDPIETSDLEAIVTLLELAAITLTEQPGSIFSLKELLDCARDYAGEGVRINDSDINIVLEKASFLKQEGKLLRLR